MESRTLPSSMKKEAWVTLVFGLDLSYIGAALVLASSLRRQHTERKLVCLVTPDVPLDSRQHLRRYYDVVSEVPYLQTLALRKQSNRFDALYSSWLDKSFTKYAVLRLVEYEKVVFLDADMLPLENPDVLFECPTPAGICSSVHGQVENSKLHGVPLPRLVINESIKHAQGVHGCLLIIKPDIEDYNKLHQMVEGCEKLGSLDSKLSPDEFIITKHFLNDWHHVHAKYGWVSWAPRRDLGVDPVFLHYLSQKPWDEGQSWPDFKYWYQEAMEIAKFNPDFLMYFNHAAKIIAEMANVEFTPELELQVSKLRKVSLQRKTEERNRRLEAARKLKIDLGNNSRNPGDVVNPPKSARASMCPRSAPKDSIQPPNSARGAREASKDPMVVKVSPNILVIDKFKRPGGQKTTEKTKDQSQKEQNSNTGNTVLSKGPGGIKPAIPKLNLRNVSNGEIGGSLGDSKWTGQHWKKHSKEALTSRADIETDWRLPSSRGDGSARTQSPTHKSQSARNWPSGGSKSARRKTKNHKTPTPRSSRADVASSWRSTPRQRTPGQSS